MILSMKWWQVNILCASRWIINMYCIAHIHIEFFGLWNTFFREKPHFSLIF